MNTQTVVQYFGSAAAVAKALGISRAAVSQWGSLVPLATAARLEKLTNGELTLDIRHYDKPESAAA